MGKCVLSPGAVRWACRADGGGVGLGPLVSRFGRGLPSLNLHPMAPSLFDLALRVDEIISGPCMGVDLVSRGGCEGAGRCICCRSLSPHWVKQVHIVALDRKLNAMLSKIRCVRTVFTKILFFEL